MTWSAHYTNQLKQMYITVFCIYLLHVPHSMFSFDKNGISCSALHNSCSNLMNVILSWNNLVLLITQILFFVQFLKVVDFKNRQKIRLFKSTYLHWKHYTSVIGKIIFIYDFFLFFPDESGPAAMQHGNSANKFSFSLLSLFVIVNIDGMIHY